MRHARGAASRRHGSRLIDSGALVRPCVESVHLPQALSIYRQQGEDIRAEVMALLDWLEVQLQDEG